MQKIGLKGSAMLAAPFGLAFLVILVTSILWGFDSFSWMVLAISGILAIMILVFARNSYRCACGKLVSKNFCPKCGKTSPEYTGNIGSRDVSTINTSSRKVAYRIGWKGALKHNAAFPAPFVAVATVFIIFAPITVMSVVYVVLFFASLLMFVLSDRNKIRCTCNALLDSDSNFCGKCRRDVTQDLEKT